MLFARVLITSGGAAGSNAFADVSTIVPWPRRAGQLFPKRAILSMKRFIATPPLPPMSLGTPPRKRLAGRQVYPPFAVSRPEVRAVGRARHPKGER